MAILMSAALGAAIGWLASRFLPGIGKLANSAAVGVIGALLACVIVVSRGNGVAGTGAEANTLLTASLGAVTLLLLWSAAQRLFLSAPSLNAPEQRPAESEGLTNL